MARSTASTIFVVVEVAVQFTIGNVTFHISSKDIVVPPPWPEVSLRSSEDTELCSCSDNPVQE
ncbi:gentisate 1,2-dioxygenase, partial [Salmonella enterica]